MALSLRWLPGLALLLTCAPAAAAPQGARYTVSLLTMSPGWHPFERLRHTALAIEDHAGHSELSYNFGTVAEDAELWHKAFAGTVPNALSTMNPGVVAMRYASRQIQVQELALSDAQAGQLLELLAADLRPDSRPARFDYFTNNCVTSVRDLLDSVSGGALKQALAGPAPRSFREDVKATLAPVPLMRDLVDLVYGPYADVPRSRYEALFLPQTLHDELAGLSLGGQPLVRGERTWSGPSYLPPEGWPSGRALPLLLVALLATGVLLSRRTASAARGRTLVGAAGALLALGMGALGALLYVLSFTPYPFLRDNQSLRVLSPLDLLLVPALLVLCSRRSGLVLRRALIAALVLLVGLSLRAALHGGAHLLGPCSQSHGWVVLWALGLRAALLVALLLVLPRADPAA